MRDYPHNNNYRITREGQVWSVRNNRYLRAFEGRNKYKRVALYRDGIKTQKFIHVLVLETYCCDCPDKMQSRHIDGNNQNNCLHNLEWCTPSTNRLDTWKHAKSSGIKVGNSKLRKENIRVIRYLHARGLSKKRLGECFSVHPLTISEIVNRKTWSWVL